MWLRRWNSSLSVVGLCLLAAAAACAEPTPLAIHLKSGRTLTGLVDSRTGDSHLSLRFHRGSGYLRKSIPWGDIASASFEGKAVDADALKELASRLKSPPPPRSERHSATSRVQPRPAPPSPPASIGIDARLANWDADVEADGLVLELFVADAEGQLTAADGTLEVELFAPRLRRQHEAPASRGYEVDLIERWSRLLSALDFSGGRAALRLPFGAIHPEFDRRVDALGLVHVRLSIPGHGIFEQSLDGVLLRPFSPVRDALLDHRGEWFLPSEGTGRGRTSYGLPRY
jgi:hypothetical protein